ncbi:MAG: ATP-binding protein [Candidatus Bathyarchaeota archaeon]|nr:ATP-binding protein [Candidatus Bathyarchaeota archaeon]MDH5745786.1 ATP-binding protein [Candidatus Bathyarchaeota archaeon]
MDSAVRGLWNVVLSGYPRSGKTTLAKKLVVENPYFARVGVDELREMLFGEVYPCRDEFLAYSLIGEIRDALLERGYSAVIDSTAPDNVTREFLLATKVKHVNRLLVILDVDRQILVARNIERFGDASPVLAWGKRWQRPKGRIPIFKFRNSDTEDFSLYYARLKEVLQSETHPFKPEFRPPHLSIQEIRETLRNFLARAKMNEKIGLE